MPGYVRTFCFASYVVTVVLTSLLTELQLSHLTGVMHKKTEKENCFKQICSAGMLVILFYLEMTLWVMIRECLVSQNPSYSLKITMLICYSGFVLGLEEC